MYTTKRGMRKVALKIGSLGCLAKTEYYSYTRYTEHIYYVPISYILDFFQQIFHEEPGIFSLTGRNSVNGDLLYPPLCSTRCGIFRTTCRSCSEGKFPRNHAI